MGVPINQQAVANELAPAWVEGLTGAQRSEAQQLLNDLVAAWAKEADPTPDPAAVLRFQRDDLEQAGTGRDAAGRLEALRLFVLRRRVDQLGAATYALGLAILDGRASTADARERGAVLLREAESLGLAVRDLPPTQEAVPIRRELGDAVMEALFAVEGKAMSARLDRARLERGSR